MQVTHIKITTRGILRISEIDTNGFILQDKVKSSRLEAKTIGEVLTLLEERGADKDSFA